MNNATSNVVLMTVADMSRMKFSLGVDELDIAKVQVGQKVNITADALQDMNFEGEISNIPAEGETQNGVTTYLVEVIISDPGTLKSGMNVNAEIIVESKKDVLYLPMGAVTKIRDMSFVMVNNEKEEDVESGRGERNDQGGRGGQAEQGASVDEQGEQGIRTYKRRTQENIEGNREQRSGGTSNIPVSMDELERKEIELGINNDEFIEIVSGLAEGETVFYTIASSAGQPNNSTGIPDIQRGGMPSGGFPSGGMRMPSGGTMRMR